MSHSKMLTARRRKKRHQKELAVLAKRAKKLRNQSAKAPSAAAKNDA